MMLDDEDSGTGLNFVPESNGMDVPSACTIVIIAGEILNMAMIDSLKDFFLFVVVRKVP